MLFCCTHIENKSYVPNRKEERLLYKNKTRIETERVIPSFSNLLPTLAPHQTPAITPPPHHSVLQPAIPYNSIDITIRSMSGTQTNI